MTRSIQRRMQRIPSPPGLILSGSVGGSPEGSVAGSKGLAQSRIRTTSSPLGETLASFPGLAMRSNVSSIGLSRTLPYPWRITLAEASLRTRPTLSDSGVIHAGFVSEFFQGKANRAKPRRRDWSS